MVEAMSAKKWSSIWTSYQWLKTYLNWFYFNQPDQWSVLP